ncbi:MAG TPA: hypothetical protein VIE66_09360 [Methylocella sp.]|jgi:hypothetical protein
MVAEVFAGMSAIKSAFEIAKGLKDIDDVARRNAAVIELQEKILAAQETQAQLIEAISNLKKRVAELEAWDGEKQRYELKSLAEGVFSYRLKKAMADSEPIHDLCTACYLRGKKSILQRRDKSMDQLMNCSECKAEIKIGNASWPDDHPTSALPRQYPR